MDKKLFINIQGGRKVSGTLRGFDIFLNLVLDDAVEETTPAQKQPIGNIVRHCVLCLCASSKCSLTLLSSFFIRLSVETA